MIEFLKAIGLFLGIGVVLIGAYVIVMNVLYWIGRKFHKAEPITTLLSNIMYPPDEKKREKSKMILVGVLILTGILYYNFTGNTSDNDNYRPYDNRGYLE